MPELRPLDLSLPGAGAESCEVDAIAIGSKQSHLLLRPASSEATFLFDCSAPATPFCSASGNSSFVHSAASSVSVSSCSSPTTEFSAAALSIERRMPRLSEEQFNDDFLADQTISLRMARPNPLSLENSFSSNLATHFDFAQDDALLPSDLSAFGLDCHRSEKPLKQTMDSPPAQHQTHGRHRSGDSSSKNSISFKLISGFMRRRHRKNSSLSTNPTVDTGRTVSSRSSSFTSTHKHEVEANSSRTSLQGDQSWPSPSPPISPIEALSFADCTLKEPIDRKGFNQTPLLPPMLGSPFQEAVAQSPLQSPSMAHPLSLSRASLATSESNYSQPEVVQPSHISKQPSMASIHYTKRKTGSLTDSIPAFMLSSQDKWSLQLGHANYTIFPEPYLPESFDLDTWRQLNDDREQAHTEYCKHQARTLEHYGPNSKTYRLTEEKWVDIDLEWKRVVDHTKTMILAKGVKLTHLASATASPNVRMPTLNPHDGKMPKLGDQNIIGPMAQSPPMQRPERAVSPLRKPQSTKLLDFKLGSIFGKGLGEDR